MNMEEHWWSNPHRGRSLCRSANLPNKSPIRTNLVSNRSLHVENTAINNEPRHASEEKGDSVG